VALLAPDPRRIADPPPQAQATDRVPDALAAGTPEPLRRDLAGLLGSDRVLHRVSDLVAYASDASPYRLIPQAVVVAHDAEDVRRVLEYGRRTGVPVTLRSGGTSLNGQGQGDGILVDVRRHFVRIAVQDDGATVRVGPGTVLGHVNRALAPHGRKLGPDPASTDAATIGGVVANNSGGMRCGVAQDSYQTLRAMSFVLPSGTTIDTEDPDAEERFAAAEPELATGLMAIREEILADAEMADRIRHKFRIKNTTGYRLVAFLDGETPLEIFRRLLVGSEGTLAYIAEAVFETVPLRPRTATAMLLFGSVDDAVATVGPLVEAGATAVELMVAATLKAAQALVETPQSWKDAPMEAAALLCEFRADEDGDLDAFVAAAEEILREHELLEPPDFRRDAETTEMYWRVREGMQGLIAEFRPLGSSLILEDVCVPPARVGEAAKDLQALLGKHGFLPGVAGHASAGNLHFVLTPSLAEPGDRDRYDAFMHEVADLIVDEYDGSLKAEHGTGRNMAPFVEKEWGAKATALMWRIKELADPDGVLGPGVVLNRDPRVHLERLKTQPEIEPVANKCIECGMCEPVCPSRWLTTTPRQRILLRREMARQGPGSPVYAALVDEYEYGGLETCAADGSCALACPVRIDTGAMVKGFRSDEHTDTAERVALEVARRYAGVERRARAGLRAPPGLARTAAGAARKVLSDELVPTWPDAMPPAAPARLPGTRRKDAAAVYLPACINRIFGPADRGLPLPDALVALSDRAGLPVWIPDDAAGHCCAVPWTSKGYREGGRYMAAKTRAALLRWTDGGRLPVVIDASSCTQGLREHAEGVAVLDAVEWVHDRLLPRLEVPRRDGSVAIHPTCASRHLGLGRRLRALAEAVAGEAVVPAAAACCGFAGDRGLLHPELLHAATRDEAAEVTQRRYDDHVSSNRTCELGMQQATGRAYRSVVQLVEERTREGGRAEPDPDCEGGRAEPDPDCQGGQAEPDPD
jgi:D-lactate dehydrogenase